jgi:hypothetical protein
VGEVGSLSLTEPRSHRIRLSLIVLIVSLLALLGFAAAASALPGDPPVAPLTPADGIKVPALEEGMTVTYSCPAYRTAEEVVEEEAGEEEGEEEEGEEEPPAPPVKVPVAGSTESYGVAFSTGNALGKDGRLVSTGFGEAGNAEAEAIKGTPNCISELVLPTAPNPPALYAGRVYWQPYRECEGCLLGYEVGPVRSFVVQPTDEEAELTLEDHIFGGYMTKVGFAGAAGLKGARVQLQLWDGSGWTTLAEELGSSSGENSFYVKLGAGHKLLRPVVVGTPGTELGLEATGRTVRKVKKGTATGVQTGTWVYALKSEREEFPLGFKVTKNGTELSGLNAAVEAFCAPAIPAPAPFPPLPSIPTEATSAVKSARISPAGTVVAHFVAPGATPAAPNIVSLTGTFFKGRFTGILTSSFLGNCLGFREFEAVPAPAPKKK